MSTARERLQHAIDRATTRRPDDHRDRRAAVVRQGDLEQVLIDCPGDEQPLNLDEPQQPTYGGRP